MRKKKVMTNKELMKEAFEASGVTVTFLAKQMDCSRNRIYSIFNGDEATATEIAKLGKLLHLSRDVRDAIFLGDKLKNRQIPD